MKRLRHAAQHFRNFLLTLTARRFDVETSEGRSKERYRRLGLSALAAAASRSINTLVSFASIPLALNYLGAERFGIWLTVGALLAMTTFADFGLGNGLVTAVARTPSSERDQVLELTSTAFYVLLPLMLAAGATFGLLHRHIAWAGLLNVPPSHGEEQVRIVVAVAVSLWLLSIPSSVAQKLQIGLQESYWASIFAAVGSVIGLVALFVAIRMTASFPWVVAALSVGPLLGVVLNFAHVFVITHPEFRPRLRDFSLSTARTLSRLGLLFFVLQLAAAVGYQSDSIVIARLLGPAYVTEYAVPYRLFSLIPIVLGFAVMPLWPAFGDAVGRADYAWAKATLRRALAISLALAAPAAALLVVLGGPIVRTWTGDVVAPSLGLLLALGAWVLVTAASAPIAMFFNGASVVLFQVEVSIAMAALNIVLSILLVRRVGVSGAIWGTVIAQSVCVIGPSFVYLRKLFSGWEHLPVTPPIVPLLPQDMRWSV